jgi:GMP synthase (glutamine-hydrolysing)
MMIYLLQLDGRVPPGIYGDQLCETGLSHRLLRPCDGEPLPGSGQATAIIVFGGYMGAQDEVDYPFLRPLKDFLRQSVEENIPVLGICLGGQLLAEVLGGRVTAGHRGEKGLCRLDLTQEGAADPLFAGLPSSFSAFEWHNDSFELPPDAIPLASSEACTGQAFRCRNAWGLQFHPEVNRQIVAAWSAKVDPGGTYAGAFAVTEAEHRAMALLLLQNFLAFASQSSKAVPG